MGSAEVGASWATATLTTVKAELAARVAALAERGIVPGLGTVLVGDDPGSQWYVGAKHQDCAELGIRSIRRDLPATATQAEVEAVIDELNADPGCTGFLVQQPTGLDEMALLSRVDPAKDVDGLHPMNLGWLVLGASITCWMVAAAFGWREFSYAAAALLALFGLSALLTIGRMSLAVTTRVEPQRVMVGELPADAVELVNV